MKELEKILTGEEVAVFKLRALYLEYGYERYKMSKFEEYDLYAGKRDFLISEGVITFTDTDGRLMALKPDVTLSIIKNYKDSEGGLSKTQYNENVYRVSDAKDGFRELTQVGLECLGDIGAEEVSEVLLLAAKSLETISESFILEVSNLDVPEAVMEHYGVDSAVKRQIIDALGKKNREDIRKICLDSGLCEEATLKICSLAEAYGKDADAILETLRVSREANEAIDSLLTVAKAIQASGYGESLCIDLSLTENTKYYNGFAIRGFVEGIPKRVLSGGQYDKLMKKMGKRSGGIGFAVYLDELS